jgi:hypothetical protein
MNALRIEVTLMHRTILVSALNMDLVSMLTLFGQHITTNCLLNKNMLKVNIILPAALKLVGV